MFEVLIREAAARFGLGDKAPALIQLLLACMTGKETGGLAGFLEKFKAAGLGPIVQSWLGGGPAARPISNSQLETALGGSGGPLPLITSRLDLPRDSVTSALGYLLPTLVGKLTPGGNTPSTLPPEIASFAAAGQALLAAPSDDENAARNRAGLGKWLPWVIVVVAVIILIYIVKNRADEAAPPATPPAASAPATTGLGPAPASQPAAANNPAPASPASEPASAAQPASSVPATTGLGATPAQPAPTPASPISEPAPAAQPASSAPTTTGLGATPPAQPAAADNPASEPASAVPVSDPPASDPAH